MKQKIDSQSDTVLVQRFNEGDPLAFKEIYYRYAKPLVLFARGYTSDLEDAGDIMQQVMTNLFERRVTFESLYGIRGYLWVSARNAALKLKQKQQSHFKYIQEKLYLSPFEEKQAENYELEATFLDTLHRHVERLPRVRKQVFEMAFYESKKVEEIALTLGLSEATIRSHKRHAIEALRRDLGQYKFDVAFTILLLTAQQGLCIQQLVSTQK